MRIFSSLRSVSLAVAGSIVLFAALPVLADSILELKTDAFLALDPGATDSITLQMTNAGTTASPDNFIGWVLGLQFVPQSGATGTVTVASGGSPLSGGTVNPMPFGDLQISQPTIAQLGSGAVINGLTNYWFMNVNTLTDLGTVAVGQTYDMGNLELTASADALGTWDVYAVQQNSPLFKTYWFDGTATEQPFGNIPWVGGGNYSVKLGEVQVVPEPSTLALLGLAGVGAGGYAEAMRRRKRKAAKAGEAIAA